MKDTIKVVDITIQKKFKELVDAKREGKTYDFMIELKKELEATLEEQRNNEHVEKIENLLQEIEMRSTKNNYIQ